MSEVLAKYLPEHSVHSCFELIKSNNIWSKSNGECITQAPVHTILETFKNIQFKGYVPENARKNIIGKIKNQDSFYAYTRHLTDQKQSFVPENQPLKNIWFSILKLKLTF